MESEIIHRYFPGLAPEQSEQFGQLGPLYREWNARINVISRQDIGNLYERHVLHSLSIARVIPFKPGTRILDAGTGGGFPGIPLAIMFPEAHFHLVDSTAKKLMVIEKIVAETGLKNITTEHCRLENHSEKYDFVVSRAVASLKIMMEWVWKNVGKDGSNELPNGILYLKALEPWNPGTLEPWNPGTNIPTKNQTLNYRIYPLKEYFTEPFFETKSLVHLF